MTVVNPYETPSSIPSVDLRRNAVHPDWNWMVFMTYSMSTFCLWAVFTVGSLGDAGWRFTCHGWCDVTLFGPESKLLRAAFPLLLAIPPTAVACAVFRYFYWNQDAGRMVTKRNFCFLLTGLVFAAINASLYDPIS